MAFDKSEGHVTVIRTFDFPDLQGMIFMGLNVNNNGTLQGALACRGENVNIIVEAQAHLRDIIAVQIEGSYLFFTSS